MLYETSSGRRSSVNHYREIAAGVLAQHGLLRTAANVKSGKRTLGSLRRSYERVAHNPKSYPKIMKSNRMYAMFRAGNPLLNLRTMQIKTTTKKIMKQSAAVQAKIDRLKRLRGL